MEFVEQGVVIPQSVLLHRSSASKYGRVPDIADEELADPYELERHVYLEALGPILALPVRSKGGWIRPALDGGVEWGAFGSIDFQRMVPEFDKARYKADKLREELGDILIRLSIVSERVGSRAKYLVLKHVRMGLLDLDHIVDDDMWNLARLFLRARRMRKEIRELEEFSRIRRQRKLEAWLASV